MKHTFTNCGALGQALVCVVFLFATSACGADEPRTLGRASCATATCHGGIIGTGPAWHSSSSIWEERDPHSRAGEVLFDDLSRRIVRALDPLSTTSEQAFHLALQKRCISCHATQPSPVHIRTETIAAEKNFRAALAEGVSCEACHGPASLWQPKHARFDWSGQQRFATTTGMFDTESLLSRTDICTRCHVGSRTADGQIRDVNHDMIAAGHPPLYFDMFQYQARLPAHWASDTESLARALPEQLTTSVESLRTRVLLSAVRLSEERRGEAQVALPHPELSEYDCAACHHSLTFDSQRQRRDWPGSALWQPWYTAGRKMTSSRAQLRLDQPQLGPLLQSLSESLLERSVQLSQAVEADPQLLLKSLLHSGQPDCRADYCSAAAWVDQVDLASRAVLWPEKSSSSSGHERFDKLMHSFRQRTLGHRNAVPSTLEILMPRAWAQQDIDSLRAELILCLEPDKQPGHP